MHYGGSMKSTGLILHLVFTFLAISASASIDLKLDKNWAVQSSAALKVGGDVLSLAQFDTSSWYETSVPATVVAVLEKNGVVSDPYFGMNLRQVPGTNYPINKIFYYLPMPEGSPFIPSWWYRTIFQNPRLQKGGHAFVKFDGINYAANIWLNGKKIADIKKVVGTFRQYEFEVTKYLSYNGSNALAVEIFAPQPDSLSNTSIDWNPAPGDKNMGLVRDVILKTTGSVALENILVTSQLTKPLDVATLKVRADVKNLSDKAIETNLRGNVEGLGFSSKFFLNGHEQKQITVSLKVPSPRLWWPLQMGKANLYDLNLMADVGGEVVDSKTISFGIREITSEIVTNGGRLFKINGKPIFIRGGGWSPDLLLKTSNLRELQELQYVRDLNLNTIRFEGPSDSDHLLDLADRMGILVMPGWACCSRWEQGKDWKNKDFQIAESSFRDQLRRHQNHPSVLAWLYGSDMAPLPKIEEMYLRILKEENWPNPTIASAASEETLAGKTGVKMTGPYDYVPPSYWLNDTEHGGAFGFNTETSMGPAVPPLESLEKMLPVDHLWPIDDVWNFHAGLTHFQQIKYFSNALDSRYGESHNISEYAMKSQVLAYDGHRAMYEAYGKRKYESTTGIIQWMLNNAWPSMIWHLYDYYLRTGGSYFGAKKALEPVHIQYSYDDESIVVVNSTYNPKALIARTEVFDFNLQPLFKNETPVSVDADATKSILTLPNFTDLTRTYFVRLELRENSGAVLSHNFYWLSIQKEVMDWPKTDFTHTPTLVEGDLTQLNTLPPVTVSTGVRSSKGETVVTLKNTGSHIAFFIRLKLNGNSGEEILPVLWEDNYITLMPGETREVTARYKNNLLKDAKPILEITGWNVLKSTTSN